MLCRRSAARTLACSLLLFWGFTALAVGFVPGENSGAPPAGGFRKLAPGVMKTIPVHDLAAEKTSRHDVVEILASDPEYAVREGIIAESPAKNARFAQDVAALEFSFKPMRFIRVDMPTKSGQPESKLVWYIVYAVRNPGSKAMRFIPHFWLEDLETHREFEEQLLPLAVPRIRDREDPNRPLLNTIEISQDEIQPAAEGTDANVWGVATWTDIDPNIDRFAVYVQGLSTAYQWTDEPGVYKPGDPPGTGRKLQVKTLQLNFWRPGDAFFEHEAEIRFGTGNPGEVDYRWFYQ